MKIIVIFAVAIIALMPGTAKSESKPKTWPCNFFHKLPANYEGCESESCSDVWTKKILKPIALHARTDKGSSVISKLKKCEETKSIRPILKILQLGLAEVLIVDNVELKKAGVAKGDYVQLLKESESEGLEYDICIGKKIIQGIGVLDYYLKSNPQLKPSDCCDVAIVSSPNVQAWVKVKTLHGKVGYTESSDFFFGRHDYDETKICPGDKVK